MVSHMTESQEINENEMYWCVKSESEHFSENIGEIYSICRWHTCRFLEFLKLLGCVSDDTDNLSSNSK